MTLRKGIFLTAADRPEYFREVMESWRNVRFTPDWTFMIRLEPTEKLPEMLEIAESFDSFPHILQVNNEVIGAPSHPYVAFETMFKGMFRDFVVSVEDDLVVSDDILEYLGWAAEEYYFDRDIATISSFSESGSDDAAVTRSVGFKSWGFGTWWDRWEEYIAPTWDHNYQTFNGYLGNEAGWDWNLATRVLPSREKYTIFPETSRLQNIGEHGVHGTSENFVQSSAFQLSRPQVTYYER